MILKFVRCLIESSIEAISSSNDRRDIAITGFLPDRVSSVPAVLLALAAGSAGMAHAQAVARYPIKHVIVIMQENRSFDQYFGTFPGADGIPPDACIPLDPHNP